MNTEKSRFPLTSYFFILLLFGGTVLLTASFFTAEKGMLLSGLRQIGIGALLIGSGEWINHPLQRSIEITDSKHYIFQKFFHRRRRPSGLGNLFEIVGLLLLFTGIADYI